MYQNEVLRNRIEAIQTAAKVEREWWDRKKSEMQADLMKEINDGSSTTSGTGSTSQKTGSDDDTVLVESGGPADSKTLKKRKSKK
jgi:translocation protein SEC66